MKLLLFLQFPWRNLRRELRNKQICIYVRNNPLYIYIAADLSEDFLTFNAATTSHRCGAGTVGQA